MDKRSTKSWLQGEVDRLKSANGDLGKNVLAESTRVITLERRLQEATDKIAELEIVRDALIDLCRKLKKAVAPGALLPILLGAGVLGALYLLGSVGKGA